MKKALKFILSFFSIIIILMVSIPIIVSMLLQVGAIQNYTVNLVTKKLSEKAETTMSISHIDLEFFSRVAIDDVMIADQRGDTMIYIEKLRVGIDGINFLNGKISLGVVDIDKGHCHLYKDSTGLMNITWVFDHFKAQNPPENPPDFRFGAREVNLNDFHFTLFDTTVEEQANGINFKNLDLKKIYFQARDLVIFNYDILVKFEHLTFQDRSGFYLQHLSSPRCAVNETGMRFEKLRLETQRSLLQFGHIYLLYDDWYAYNDFVNRVTIDVDIKPSRLSYRTLSYFTKQKDLIPTTIELSGRVRGTVPNLHGFFNNLSTQNTSLSAAFSVVGLPDINKTKFNLSIDDLTTSARDIETLYSDFTQKSLSNIYPILERSGNIHVNGTFEGLLTEFLATAKVSTAQGTFDASLNVIPNNIRSARFMGKVNSGHYNLGEAIGVKDIGRIAFNANVDMHVSDSNAMVVNTTANISNFYFANYDYNNISIDGHFVGRTYEGTIKSEDPNCSFLTKGFFDLRNPVPAYNYAMNVYRADLYKLGFNKRDSVSVLSANFTATGLGTNLDDINGEASFEKLTYVNHIDTVRTGTIKIISQNSDSLKSMKLLSDFADVEISGTNSYSQIFRYMAQSAQKYIPAFPEAEQIVTKGKTKIEKKAPREYAEGSYKINVDVKRANNVASIFVPGLELAQGTKLDFSFDPRSDKFRLSLDSDFIGTHTENAQMILLRGYNSADSILFNINAKSVEAGSVYMPNFSLKGGVSNNIVKVGLDFDNPADGSMAHLVTTTTIYRTEQNLPQIKIMLSPSIISIEKSKWSLPPSYALIDSTGIDIHQFSLKRGRQKLFVDGRLGRSSRDSLTVKLDSMNMRPLSMFTANLGYKISGKMTGTAKGTALLGDMRFDALMKMDDLHVNDYSLGNPVFFSKWDPSKKMINMGISSEEVEMPIYGYYDLPNKKYFATIKFPKLDMVLLEPLLKGIFADTYGEADANLTLSGGKETTALAGTIDIKNYSFKVDYTKARYKLSGLVKVENSCFKADGLPLSDNLAGSATVNAYLNTDNFKNLKFGADVKFNNILALNTTIRDNDIFYGKAYGTGNFNIVGDEHSTKMNITANTALSSEFYLPFTGIASIDEANFIKFVNPRKTEAEEEERKSIRQKSETEIYASDFDIKIALHVLQNTKAEISMVSEYMNNQIKGQGDGLFNIHINPSQDIFSMTGTYDIMKGSYRMIIGLVDKEISINPHSTVSWTGNPAEPEVNLDAIYKVKASLQPLLGGSVPNGYSTTANIDCGLNITGKLFSPQLNLSVTAPSADPETQNILRNALNTQEAITNQFFMLFIAKTFIPNMSASSVGSAGGMMAGATGFEFLSNQISNLISSEKLNIKLGYRPKSEYTSDEFNFDFQTDIIPNKLSIEVGGYYNTGNNNAYERSPFSGDAYLTWVVNKSETLRLKGFTRVIERFDETQGLQETGVGVYFRQDFQTVSELRQKWFLWMESIRKKRIEKKELKSSKTNKQDTVNTNMIKSDTVENSVTIAPVN